ncbi:MAG: DUF2892 domain-containing protein [Alphaproteobacteria bacterium]|nr:DUF2892 domain-containing protein [Alphaproteobacteria bacterium]
MTIPSTVGRVPRNTPDAFNQKIIKQTERNIAYYAAHPEEIDARLEELDQEWDVERTLEANAASVSLASVLLGIFVSRRFLYLPALVGGFLLQHAVEGWCPPLPVFRRMGVRTQTEIERERYALKALRGDFDHVHTAGQSDENVTRVSQRVLEAVK